MSGFEREVWPGACNAPQHYNWRHACQLPLHHKGPHRRRADHTSRRARIDWMWDGIAYQGGWNRMGRGRPDDKYAVTPWVQP